MMHAWNSQPWFEIRSFEPLLTMRHELAAGRTFRPHPEEAAKRPSRSDHQEDGVKNIWVLDNKVALQPVSIATFPQPGEADYKSKGGHFGPHNLHENRPGTFVSSQTIFTTWQNAGVRVFDIGNAHQPVETGAWVPPAPAKMMDHRPNRARVIQSADVFVDTSGLIYSTDYNAGLFILEFGG